MGIKQSSKKVVKIQKSGERRHESGELFIAIGRYNL